MSSKAPHRTAALLCMYWLMKLELLGASMLTILARIDNYTEQLSSKFEETVQLSTVSKTKRCGL